MDGISFEIKKHLGVIEKYYITGWTKELNIISWNNMDAKYDIRDWSPDHQHMSRGITLSENEAKTLLEILTKEFQ